MRSVTARLVALVVAAALSVGALMVWYLEQKAHAAFLQGCIDATPMAIEIGEAITGRTESDLQNTCGLGVLRMSDRTVEALKKEGVHFLSGAKQARGHSSNSDWRWAYSEWRKTPIPDTSPESRLAAAHDCFVAGATKQEVKLANDIWRAAQTVGGYHAYLYTIAEVLVLPELGLVVFVVNG
jgi:hypothetical protein